MQTTFQTTYQDNGKTFRLVARVEYKSLSGQAPYLSITGDLYSGAHHSSGCLHEEIAQHIPELATLLKWHLTGRDGPMHYLANTIYLAGNVDHNGNTATHKRQIRNGRTKQLVWRHKTQRGVLVDYDTCPGADFEPCTHNTNGKERELDKARASAVWFDATDDELTSPGLEERLKARLPALMAEFRGVVEGFGFTY